MRDILHLWRESAAGGDPFEWWGTLARSTKAVLLADGYARERRARKAIGG